MQLQCLHGQSSGTADTEEPGQADWICPGVLGGQVFGKYERVVKYGWTGTRQANMIWVAVGFLLLF